MFGKIVPVAIFETILPEILNRTSIYSRGETNATSTAGMPVQSQVGLVLGLFYVAGAVVSTPIGWLVSEYKQADLCYSLGMLLQGGSTLAVAVAPRRDVIVMGVYASVYGLGTVACDVGVFKTMADRYRDDGERSRAMLLSFVLCTLGSAGGFLFGTMMYETFGFAATFWAIAVADLAVAIAYPVVASNTCAAATDEEEILIASGESVDYVDGGRRLPSPDGDEVGRADDDRDQSYGVVGTESEDTTIRESYVALLTPAVSIVCCLQTTMVYAGFRAIATIAPFWLQSTLRITPVQNGRILAVTSAIDAGILLIVSYTTNTNRKRWITLMFFMTLQSVGFIFYPFIRSVYSAALTEVAIRASKAVLMPLSPLLMFYIVDKKRVGTYARATALMSFTKGWGRIFGSLVSSCVVPLWGFDVTCTVFGLSLVPLVLASPIFETLDR